MASEGTLSVKLSVNKGSLKLSRVESQTFDVATARRSSGTQSIGTSHEALGISSDLTPGKVLLKHVGTTNYIEVGIVVASTFYPVHKMIPGDIEVFRLASGAALFARADTAAEDLDFEVVAA